MTTPARTILWRPRLNTEDGAAVTEYVPAWPLDAEGPGENCRNALALIGAYRGLTPFGRSPEADECLKAIQRRIEIALDQIEGRNA